MVSGMETYSCLWPQDWTHGYRPNSFLKQGPTIYFFPRLHFSLWDLLFSSWNLWDLQHLLDSLGSSQLPCSVQNFYLTVFSSVFSLLRVNPKLLMFSSVHPSLSAHLILGEETNVLLEENWLPQCVDWLGRSSKGRFRRKQMESLCKGGWSIFLLLLASVCHQSSFEQNTGTLTGQVTWLLVWILRSHAGWGKCSPSSLLYLTIGNIVLVLLWFYFIKMSWLWGGELRFWSR